MKKEVSRQATIRRYQDNLVVLGTGVIAFGVWALVKAVMLITIGRQNYQSSGSIDDPTSAAVSYGSLIFLAMVELALRTFVGMRARAEGKGRKTGHGYLVIVALMILMSTLVLASSVAAVVAFQGSLFNTIVTFSIEATSLLLLFMLIYSAVKLRRMAPETS